MSKHFREGDRERGYAFKEIGDVAGLSGRDVHAVFSAIYQLLHSQTQVCIPGFGKFKKSKTKAELTGWGRKKITKPTRPTIWFIFSGCFWEDFKLRPNELGCLTGLYFKEAKKRDWPLKPHYELFPAPDTWFTHGPNE